LFSRAIPSLLLFQVIAFFTAAGPEPGRPFEVAPAQQLTIDGLQLTFEGVGEDSRCPTGADCAWAGDAAAAFTLEKPPAHALHRTLHTNGRFERQTVYEGYVVRLDDVRPYPKEGVTTAPADYRAVVIVRKQ